MGQILVTYERCFEEILGLLLAFEGKVESLGFYSKELERVVVFLQEEVRGENILREGIDALSQLGIVEYTGTSLLEKCSISLRTEKFVRLIEQVVKEGVENPLLATKPIVNQLLTLFTPPQNESQAPLFYNDCILSKKNSSQPVETSASCL